MTPLHRIPAPFVAPPDALTMQDLQAIPSGISLANLVEAYTRTHQALTGRRLHPITVLVILDRIRSGEMVPDEVKIEELN